VLGFPEEPVHNRVLRRWLVRLATDSKAVLNPNARLGVLVNVR
jgi:hypothetical protein